MSPFHSLTICFNCQWPLKTIRGSRIPVLRAHAHMVPVRGQVPPTTHVGVKVGMLVDDAIQVGENGCFQGDVDTNKYHMTSSNVSLYILFFLLGLYQVNLDLGVARSLYKHAPLFRAARDTRL